MFNHCLPACKNHPTQTHKKVNMRPKKNKSWRNARKNIHHFHVPLCNVHRELLGCAPKPWAQKRWVQSFSHPLMGVKHVFFHMPAEKNQTNKTKLEKASNCAAAKPAAQETWPRLGKCFVENGSRFECTTNASAWSPPTGFRVGYSLLEIHENLCFCSLNSQFWCNHLDCNGHDNVTMILIYIYIHR